MFTADGALQRLGALPGRIVSAYRRRVYSSSPRVADASFSSVSTHLAFSSPHFGGRSAFWSNRRPRIAG